MTTTGDRILLGMMAYEEGEKIDFSKLVNMINELEDLGIKYEEDEERIRIIQGDNISDFPNKIRESSGIVRVYADNLDGDNLSFIIKSESWRKLL